MPERPIFSTNPRPTQADQDDKNATTPLSSGPLKMRLETKGRGGKAVTVLFNIPLPLKDAVQLGKDLQQKLGVGGTFKDGCIELRGDLRDKVEKTLATQGIPIKRAGG